MAGANHEFSVPDIFLVEVAQALLRHMRERRLGQADLGAAVRELRGRVTISLGSEQLIQRALALAILLDHRLHDCVYLALAEAINGALLTADLRLARKVRQRGLPIHVLILTDPAP